MKNNFNILNSTSIEDDIKEDMLKRITNNFSGQIKYHNDNEFEEFEEYQECDKDKDLILKDILKNNIYLSEMISVLKTIRNIKILDKNSEEYINIEKKLNDWLKIIEEDFIGVIKSTKEYILSIKNFDLSKDIKNKNSAEDFAIFDRNRTIQHDALICCIVRTIRDIKFNFDISAEEIKNSYLKKLNSDQDRPDYLSSYEVEKIKFKKSLFFPDVIFPNNVIVPTVKTLKENGIRTIITDWSLEFYNSVNKIIKKIGMEEINKIFKSY